MLEHNKSVTLNSISTESHVEVQPDPTDVAVAGADAVCACARERGGGGLDKVGAVLVGHGAAR